MKGFILKENLKKCLSLIERISGKNLNLPVLENVLIKTDKTNIYCVCTDLEVAIETQCPAKIEKEGEICVPIKPFLGFIENVPNEKISFEEKNAFLYITSNQYQASLKTFSSQDFPLIPKTKKETFFEVKEENLLEALLHVFGTSSLSDLKPEITGVFFSFFKNKLKCAATDSFRLAEKTVPCDSLSSSKTSFILPSKTAQELIHLLQGRKETVELSVESNQVSIEEVKYDGKNPKFKTVSRVIDGEFPQYEQIIPKTHLTQAWFQKEELIGAIKAASLFSSKLNDIQFHFHPTKGEYTLATENPELGKQTTTLAGQGKGEDAEIVFNWKFLLDGIQRIESSEVMFECNGDMGPAVLKPVGDATFIYIIMPIKNA